MIAIDDILVSDDVVEAKFVCDLQKCKGGCCEDGDAGAPLERKEKKLLDENFEAIRPYLTPEGLEVIRESGKYIYDNEFGWVTPTIGGKICAYGSRDRSGIIRCGIEQAYNDGKLEWKKPMSCHLYPVKVKKGKLHTYINYEPRETLCKPGCSLGRKMKMPVYRFLEEALIRKFGTGFYNALQQIAEAHFDEAEKK